LRTLKLPALALPILLVGIGAPSHAQQWTDIQDCVAQCVGGLGQSDHRCKASCEAEWRDQREASGSGCSHLMAYPIGHPCSE